MKNIFTLFSFISINLLNFAQVQFTLTGSCQYTGSYSEGDISWADASFWEGVAGATSSWGTPNMLATSTAITGNLVLVEGDGPVSHGNCTMDMACNGVAQISNSAALTGNIAVIRRGGCEFGTKALAAQNAGAIGVVIVNAVGDPINMGGGTDGPMVTIPTLMVSGDLGATICDAISSGCTEAFFGNIVGYYADNLSLKKGDIYRPNRTVDYAQIYDGVNNIHGFTPGALIKNFGTNSQTNITVTCKVFALGNSIPIYAETSPPFDLAGVIFDVNGVPYSEEVWVAFSTPFENTSFIQELKFVYTIDLMSTDQDVSDNEVSSFFRLSNNLFSYAQIDSFTGKPYATSGVGPTTDPSGANSDYYMVCNHFFEPNAIDVMAIGTWFQGYTYDPLESTSIEEKIVKCVVYEWENSNHNYAVYGSDLSGQIPDTNQLYEITRGEFFYGGDYQDSLIYVPYNDVVELEAGKHYLFCNRVEVTGNLAGLTGFKFRLDDQTDFSATSGRFWDDVNGTGIPSPTNGSPTTLIVEKPWASTLDRFTPSIEEQSSSIVQLDYYDGLEDQNHNRELMAFPNPTADIITVPFGSVTGKATINIIDVTGRVVSTQVINLTGGNVNINVTDLESGLYNFNVVYADGTKADFKVVVSK